MHGLVAARLGDSETALRYFHQTTMIDLADTHAAMDGGVHIAALGGIWMLVVFGFAGVSSRNDGVACDPRLPPGWRSLALSVQWRRRRLRLRIDQDDQVIEAKLESGAPMTLFVRGERHELRPDLAVRVFI
jgi:trehalose/maltose hydrolase-like predicted phosphorylase